MAGGSCLRVVAYTCYRACCGCSRTALTWFYYRLSFGWSKTLVAGAFALTRIESGLLGPLQGWFVDRFGPRIVLQVGVVLYGIGFMLFSQVETALTFYLTFALIRHWFEPRWLRHCNGGGG